MKASPQPKPIVQPDPDALRNALRFWTTGVTIVTASHNGVTHGMTANSFTSLSLNPPLVSISLEKVTRTYQLVKTCGVFAVTVLAQDSQALSDRFAGRDSVGSDRFAGLETFTLETGSPMLSLGLAYFDCRVVASHDAGTHTVFIGEVLACGSLADGEAKPLVYFNRAYRQIKP